MGRTGRRRAVWSSAIVTVATVLLMAAVAATASPTHPVGAWIPGTQPTPSVPEPTWSAPSPPDPQQRFTELIDGYMAENDLAADVAVSDGGVELVYSSGSGFETASIVKVEILVRWLLVRQDGDLPAREHSLAQRMIVESDNAATDQLCAIITGLTDPDDVPGGVGACTASDFWGVDVTSAADQLHVLDAAFNSARLTPHSRDVVRDLMSSVVPYQAWGISAAASGAEQVWLKNGWDRRDGWIVHSIGLIDAPVPIRIAVLTQNHVDFETGVSHVEELAKLAREALSPTTVDG